VEKGEKGRPRGFQVVNPCRKEGFRRGVEVGEGGETGAATCILAGGNNDGDGVDGDGTAGGEAAEGVEREKGSLSDDRRPVAAGAGEVASLMEARRWKREVIPLPRVLAVPPW
jgi:hypothetical protein